MRFILTLLVVFMTSALSAKVVKPVLDNDLSHRYDTNFKDAADRSVAGDKPEPVDQVKENWNEEDYSDDDSSRDPNAVNPEEAGENFEKQNENGIRYWKY